MSLPSRYSTVGLACDSSPFNNEDSTRSKSNFQNTDSNCFLGRAPGLPPRPSTLELGRGLPLLHNTPISPMNGVSQARFLIPIYKQHDGAYTHIAQRNNERYAEPVFSPAEGMNMNYGNLCACQANFYHSYGMMCNYGGIHCERNSPRQKEEPTAAYREELPELERRHRMEQISRQCHFPPPTDGLLPHRDMIFKEGQFRSAKLSRQIPGVIDLATTQVNDDDDDDALGTHSHEHCYLQALKSDYEKAKDKIKPKSKTRKRLKKRITLPKPTHQEPKKSVHKTFIQDQRVRKMWVDNQKSLLQGLLSQQKHDQTEPLSDSGFENITTTEFKDDRSIDSEVQFIRSTFSSQATCTDNTPLTTSFNHERENFLLPLPSEIRLNEVIYEEQATPTSESGFENIITQESKNDKSSDSEIFTHSPSLSYAETCSSDKSVTSLSQDRESFRIPALPLERNVLNKTIYEADIPYSDYGGYTFDYGNLPIIVKVHTIKDTETRSWWKKLDGADKCSSTENIPWKEMSGGLSPSNDGGSNEDKGKQWVNNSGMQQNAPENNQVEFDQTAILSCPVQPVQSTHMAKSEVLVNRNSRELHNHVDSNNFTQRGYSDPNEDLATKTMEIGEFLQSKERGVCKERKTQGLSYKEDLNELRRKIETVTERIMKEKIPDKKDILCSVKSLLMKRLTRLTKKVHQS